MSPSNEHPGLISLGLVDSRLVVVVVLTEEEEKF